MKNNRLAIFAFLALLTCACQEYKNQQILFSQAEAFSKNGVFQVFADFPDEMHFGNAFLVQKNVLLTAAHIFDAPDGQETKPLIYVRADRKLVPARLVRINRYQDVAVLYAIVPGDLLELRDARERDEYAFIAGFLPYESNTAVLSNFQMIKARLLATSLQVIKKITNPRLVAETKLANGLSGSPLIGLDGKVLGMFVVFMSTGQPLAEFVGVRQLRENITLYEYSKKTKDQQAHVPLPKPSPDAKK